MQILRTFGWKVIEREKRYTEILIPASNVASVVPYEDESGDSTCIVITCFEEIHVDVPIDKMLKHLSKVDYDSEEVIDTHPSFCSFEKGFNQKRKP